MSKLLYPLGFALLLCACSSGGGGGSTNGNTNNSLPSSSSSSQALSSSSELSSSSVDSEASSSESSSSSEPVNQPPIAHAGSDVSANPNTAVTLNATLSSDPENDFLRFSWTQISGPSTEIVRQDSQEAEFTPTVTGTYVFEVAVLDLSNNVDTDQVTITVQSTNQLPDIVFPVTGFHVDELSVGRLEAESVSDPDGTINEYFWAVRSDSQIQIEFDDPRAMVAEFTAPELSETRFVYVTLTVTDNNGGQSTEATTLYLDPVVEPPSADAGTLQIVSAGDNVTLDASNSADSDGVISTFQWSTHQGPAAVELQSPSSAQASFSAPNQEGLYVFRLDITDNHGNSDEAYTQVYVTSSLFLQTRRLVDPARLQIQWNSSFVAEQFNLSYTKNIDIDPETGLPPQVFSVFNVSTPFSIDATFNEYQNVRFTLQALSNGVVIAEEELISGHSNISLDNENGNIGCAVEGNAVNCWGLDAFDSSTNQLINPRQVAMGYSHVCALDDIGVSCWGEDSWGETNVPDLVNPSYVYVSGDTSCAIDDNGTQCWGFGTSTSPEISNPTAITKSCAMSATELACTGDLTNPPTVNQPMQLSTYEFGASFGCVLDADGIKCWGYDSDGQTTPPPLSNPTQVSVGARHACALDDTGVVCWGDNGNGQLNVPNLINPVEIESAPNYTCAKHDLGLECWGKTLRGDNPEPEVLTLDENSCGVDDGAFFCWSVADYPSFDNVEYLSTLGFNHCLIANGDVSCTDPQLPTPPDLNTPYLTAVGSDYACAADADGIHCWGGFADAIPIPPLAAPTELQSNGIYNCALNTSELACWGANNLNLPSVSVPSSLTLSRNGGCVIDQGQIKCWGQDNFAGSLNPPELSNPTKVVLDRLHGCALDDNGVHCWGRTGVNSGELSIPTLYNPRDIFVGNSKSCALDDYGLICWGYEAYNGYGWRAVPRI